MSTIDPDEVPELDSAFFDNAALNQPGQSIVQTIEQQKGLTPWLPGYWKPVRTGWYERQFHPGVTRMVWWNGQRWYMAPKDKMPSLFQYIPWRGLENEACS